MAWNGGAERGAELTEAATSGAADAIVGGPLRIPATSRLAPADDASRRRDANVRQELRFPSRSSSSLATAR